MAISFLLLYELMPIAPAPVAPTLLFSGGTAHFSELGESRDGATRPRTRISL